MTSPDTSTEVYSFVSCVFSLVGLFVWLVWTWVPQAWLAAYGLTYYPDTWWALALPTQLVATIAFIVYTYLALNLMSACSPESPEMLSDKSTPTSQQLFHKAGEIPDIMDVDLAVVNRYLFQAPS
eukprot:TRINITY_DN77386_c0_g1_i2.p2 TRINITY_DN77386_c0_g1~~TRINITY_DN77386_c0_g1_i2.p2  ORF type:complete len:125 (-),score=15.13 TRINITY_DN77386_c0_g1_i2:165-539(-)